eukprot:1196351-Prorocentrum_minimum.AAC.4
MRCRHAAPLRVSAVLLQMQKYRPIVDPVVETFVRATMGMFTRSQIKKAAFLMDVLTDWIICVTNSIETMHLEGKILEGELVDNPFRNTLSEREPEAGGRRRG